MIFDYIDETAGELRAHIAISIFTDFFFNLLQMFSSDVFKADNTCEKLAHHIKGERPENPVPGLVGA